MVGIRKKSMIDKCIEDKLINSDRSKIDKLFNDNINLANKMAAKYYSTPY